MRRVFLAALVSVMAAGSAMAQDRAADRMSDAAIGPIRAGMPITEIETLGLPIARREVNIEGDDYTEYVVTLRPGVQVRLYDLDGRADDVTTSSPAFVTERGAHVGSTLQELRRLYPEGRAYVGYEGDVGRYFSFSTRVGEPAGHFYFDADRLSENCFEQGVQCPSLGRERATSYSAVYEPPETSLRPRAIGPVLLGMTEAEVAALGYTMRGGGTRGAERHYVVSVAAGRDIGVTFRQGRAARLTTTSGGFHAYRGGRVGATLDELRSRYPEGRVERDSGPYLTFVIAPGHAFMFDTRENTGTCTRWDGAPCPEFGRNRAIRYSVTEDSR